ncbi:MAG: mreD [Chlamydiales bacterium]|nr:mreD [Chlamydiales bacterium]
MSLDKRNLNTLFALTLLLTLLTPAMFPTLRLLYFAPFLIVSFYQCPISKCLWYAFFCGICLDLVTSEARFGIYALDFIIVTIILYPQKHHFFADNISTLPIMTYFFSCLAALIHLLVSSIFNQSIPIGWRWILSDLLIMPMADMFYATAIFVVPYLIFGKRTRKGKEYFMS